MSKTIFIASSEAYTGKSVITLGVISILIGEAQKVGYFKPIIPTGLGENQDVHIETVLSNFNLDIKFADAYAFTRAEAMRYHEKGSEGEMIDTLIGKFKALEEKFDFTVIEGSDFIGEGTVFELDMNILIAKNLNAPALLVISGDGKNPQQIVHEALNFLRSFKDKGVYVLGIVANKIDQLAVDEVNKLLREVVDHNVLLAVIPFDKKLQNPSIKDIYEKLKGKLLFGGKQIANQVDNYVTGAMQLPSFLSYIKENVLIVTPGDRGDIIIGALRYGTHSRYTAGWSGTAPDRRVAQCSAHYGG
jgi:phosphate acetyltransferase